MEPIISPWLIYLLGVMDGLKETLTIISIVIGIGFVFWLIIYIIFIMDGNKDELERVKRFSFCPYVFAVLLIITILLPSKNTLIGMIIAQQITPNNVSSAIKTGKDFKNELKKDVIDIIELATKEKSKEK